jgi:hypothetical protein
MVKERKGMGWAGLELQVGLFDLGVVEQSAPLPFHDHASVFRDVGPVGQAQTLQHILRNEEDRQPLFLVQLAHGLEDPLASLEGKPEGRLLHSGRRRE